MWAFKHVCQAVVGLGAFVVRFLHGNTVLDLTEDFAEERIEVFLADVGCLRTDAVGVRDHRHV